MNNMNKKQRKSITLLNDQNSRQEQNKNKENLQIVLNGVQNQKFKERRDSFRKKIHGEMPFVERFKGKLFIFNKLGNMQKLQTLKQPKPSLLPKPHSRKNFLQINKINLPSRHSISTKHTTRQTKSLDTSKVSSVSIGQKYRYAYQHFQIKQQQCEETIIKAPKENKKLVEMMERKVDSKGDERKQSKLDGAREQSERGRQRQSSVRRFFVDAANSQNTTTHTPSPCIDKFGPQCISLDNSRNRSTQQDQLSHFPRLKTKIKPFYISKRHSTNNYISKQITDLFKPQIHHEIISSHKDKCNDYQLFVD